MVASAWGEYNYSETRNLRGRKLHERRFNTNEDKRVKKSREKLAGGRRLFDRFISLPEDLQAWVQERLVASWQGLISLPVTPSLDRRA